MRWRWTSRAARHADALAAPRRVDREAAHRRDPRALVDALPGHRADALAVDLEHEHAVRVRLCVRALDVRGQRLARRRAHRREKRCDVLVREELDEERDVRPASRVAASPSSRGSLRALGST